jgi:Mor family transcriptional regulator
MSDSANSRNSSVPDCEQIIAALPRTLRGLARRVGPAGAVELAQRVGGQRVYVCRGGRLSRLVRPELVEALIAERVSGAFDVPLATALETMLRDRAIRADAAAGIDRDTLVDRYGLGARQIRKIVKDGGRA